MRMAERLCADGEGAPVAASGTLEADKRKMEGSKNIRIVSKSPVYLYGMRPVDKPGAPDLEFLSLCEFLRYWRVELAAFPRSEAEMSAAVSNEYQAVLTSSGIEQVREAGREKVEAGEDGPQMGAQLKAGVDYVVKTGGSCSWVPFPDVPEMEILRHTWVLVRNERPRNPSFHGAPQPKHGAGEEDRNGLLLMVVFERSRCATTLIAEPRTYVTSVERTRRSRRRRWNG